MCYSIFSFMCMFCRSLFVILCILCLLLCCLSYIDLRILITPMISSIYSCLNVLFLLTMVLSVGLQFTPLITPSNFSYDAIYVYIRSRTGVLNMHTIYYNIVNFMHLINPITCVNFICDHILILVLQPATEKSLISRV